MPLYSLICTDKPDSLALRLATRPSHLAYWDTTGAVRLGGPRLDPESGDPAGSLMIIEADDYPTAQALAGADPYVTAGLFQSIEVRPFRLVIGQL